jgi:hypothetical protein
MVDSCRAPSGSTLGFVHEYDMDEELANAGAKLQMALLRSKLGSSTVPSDSEDPLQYYRSLDGRFIGAALTVVRQLLAIPAGESHCERCFSWADGFVTKLRSRTGNQALEMQLIL